MSQDDAESVARTWLQDHGPHIVGGMRVAPRHVASLAALLAREREKEREFNVNDKIRARLKPEAWAEFDRRHRELGLDPAIYRAHHPETDGWSEWQLWEFMQYFGPITRMGPPTPFETTIVLLGKP